MTMLCRYCQKRPAYPEKFFCTRTCQIKWREENASYINSHPEGHSKFSLEQAIARAKEIAKELRIKEGVSERDGFTPDEVEEIFTPELKEET